MFETSGSKSHIGTPRTNLAFTPTEWEKEFCLTGSWMSCSASFPGREWKLTADYFANGEPKSDPAFLFRTFPMSRAWEAFQLYDDPASVRHADQRLRRTRRKCKWLLLQSSVPA